MEHEQHHAGAEQNHDSGGGHLEDRRQLVPPYFDEEDRRRTRASRESLATSSVHRKAKSKRLREITLAKTAASSPISAMATTAWARALMMAVTGTRSDVIPSAVMPAL